MYCSVRSYDEALQLQLLDEFGAIKLAELSQADLQRFVGRMLAPGAVAVHDPQGVIRVERSWDREVGEQEA